MQLKILVPSGVFASIADVERIVVMTPDGLFRPSAPPDGLRRSAPTGAVRPIRPLPQDEVHLAVDAGMLIKTGADVLVCVRHAIAGADLGRLRQAVEQELKQLGEQESSDRKTLAHLESGLIREFVKLQRA